MEEGRGVVGAYESQDVTGKEQAHCEDQTHVPQRLAEFGQSFFFHWNKLGQQGTDFTAC